jgi:short-subunit dehydrogenase
MEDFAFLDNVVIVTGASSGIGRAVALQLADQGAWLALAARRIQRLEAVAAQCRERGGQAQVVPADVAVEAQCNALIGQTLALYGRIDTLINNAGITMWAPFDQVQDLAPLEDIMQVNFWGSVYCTYYALPHLKEAQGRIVGVSSLTGKTGVPTRSVYAASKHAMAGFFDSLRVELMDTDVSVTMVYPGFVATDVRRRAVGPGGEPLGESPVQEDAVMTPEACARIIIAAAARRRREVVMTLRGKLGQWLKLIAPGLVDRIARRAIERGH